MHLKKKSEMVKSLITNLNLPKGSSLKDPTISLGKDAAGSPEYIHAYEHERHGKIVQVFMAYVSDNSVTLQYEYSTSCFQPFSGSNQIEEAVEDVGRFLKRGCELITQQDQERRQN
jgi:hypothetical protein